MTLPGHDEVSPPGEGVKTVPHLTYDDAEVENTGSHMVLSGTCPVPTRYPYHSVFVLDLQENRCLARTSSRGIPAPMPNPAVPLPPSSHPVRLGRIRIGHLG